MDGQWLRLSHGNAAGPVRVRGITGRHGVTITALPRAAWCHIEKLRVAQTCCSHTKSFTLARRQRSVAAERQALVQAWARKFANPLRYFGDFCFVQMLDVQVEMERESYEGPGDICSEFFRSILHGIAALGDERLQDLTLAQIVEEYLVTDAIDLLRHLEQVAPWLPVSNFKREQQVKTVKSGVHFSVFRSPQALDVYTSAAHRFEDCLYEASEADFKWAEREERRAADTRRAAKVATAEALPAVVGLTTTEGEASTGGDQLDILEMEVDEAIDHDNSAYSVKEIRQRLKVGAVCEVVYDDTPGVYLAVVQKTPAGKVKKVELTWLHELVEGSDVYIPDPWPHEVKQVWINQVVEPLSNTHNVSESEATQLLGQGNFKQAVAEIRADAKLCSDLSLQVWRRRASVAAAAPVATIVAASTASSSAVTDATPVPALSAASSCAAASSATFAAGASSADDAAKASAAAATTTKPTAVVATTVASSTTTTKPPVSTAPGRKVPDVALFGKGNERRCNCPILTDSAVEYANDLQLANMWEALSRRGQNGDPLVLSHECGACSAAASWPRLWQCLPAAQAG